MTKETRTVTTEQAGEQMLMPARLRTKGDRMEVPSGAHERPSKQREPPRKPAAKDYGEWRRRSVRHVIRQQFVLYNARSPFPPPLPPFIDQEGSRSGINFLPTESTYVGSVEIQAQRLPDRLKKPRTESVGTDRLGRVPSRLGPIG